MDWSKKIIVIELLFISVLFQIVWQFSNNGLPISDGGDHFRIAYLIYLAFQEGFGKGIDFFFHTGGKPILFSAFAAPLVFFAKFDILLPIRLSLIGIQLFIVLAYYWLFTFRIRPMTSALLAGFIVTTPFIFSIHTQFMPETIWHMWFVFFLAAIYRSEHLTNPGLSMLAGGFLALTILARPAESIVLIFPALGLYFCYLYIENKITSLRDIFLSVAVAFLPIVVCFLCSIYNFNYFIGIASIILAIIFLPFLSMRRNANSSSGLMIEKFSLPFSILCSGWLLFYGNHIFHWAFDNSFGAGAKTNDQVNLHRNIFAIFWEVIGAYGALSITTLFLLFGISFLFANKKTIHHKSVYFVSIAIVLTLMPMLIAYSLTGTSDMRRIYLGVVLLVVGMCFFIFWKAELPKLVEKLFILVLSLLFFIQLFSITAITTQNRYLLMGYQQLTDWVGSLAFRTPLERKNKDENVIYEIKSLGISDAKIAVFSLGMFTNKVLFQAESLRYVTLGIDKSLNFGTLWGYTDYEPYEEVVSRLRNNGFEYVLLEDLGDPITDPVLRKRLRSHTFFVHELLLRINQNGENNLPGLALIRKFKIDDRFIYVFKAYDPDAPKITATSQLDSYGSEGLFEFKQPGWHAEKFPKYPQVLYIEFRSQRDIKTVGLLPQDGNFSRAPKSIRIKASNDGKSWVTAATSNDGCVANVPGGWHNVKLAEEVKARFLKIEILANCGDPDFLTLRGLRIE